MLMVPLFRADAWVCPTSKGRATPGTKADVFVTFTVALNGDVIERAAETIQNMLKNSEHHAYNRQQSAQLLSIQQVMNNPLSRLNFCLKLKHN